MSSNGPEAGPDDRARTQGPSIGARDAAAAVTRPAGRGRLLAVLAGILAGLIAFAGGEMAIQVVPAETVNFNVQGMARSVDTRDTPRVITRTAALAFGALGLCLGGGLGIAGGLSRRPVSPASAATGGGLGAVLGAALGAGLALGLVPPFIGLRSGDSDLDIIYGMLLHGLAWAPLGLAAGLGFAVGTGDRRLIGRAAVAGLAGAVVGSLASDIVGAVVFPLAKTDATIPETWPARLMARLIVCLGTAVAVALIPPAPEPSPGVGDRRGGDVEPAGTGEGL